MKGVLFAPKNAILALDLLFFLFFGADVATSINFLNHNANTKKCIICATTENWCK